VLVFPNSVDAYSLHEKLFFSDKPFRLVEFENIWESKLKVTGPKKMKATSLSYFIPSNN
jgi:hypothetical protein